MGKIVARPFEDGDLAQVLRVHARVYDDADARRLGQRWRWSQQDNLFPAETYRWVLTDGDGDGEGVVGFLNTIPQPFWLGGERVLAHSPCDYAVVPEHRFHGVKLMRAFAKQCQNCVTFDDVEPTIAVNRWLGIRSVARFESYILPLDARAIVRAIVRAVRVRRHALPLPRLARCLLRPASRIGRSHDTRIDLLPGFDARFNRFADALARDRPAMVCKDQRFLEWRYRGPSPHGDAVIATVPDRAGELAGYAILYSNRVGSRRGAVLDLQTRRGDERTRSALLRYAVDHFRRRRVASVNYQRVRSATGPSGTIFESHGFVPVSTPLQLRARGNRSEQALTSGQARS